MYEEFMSVFEDRLKERTALENDLTLYYDQKAELLKGILDNFLRQHHDSIKAKKALKELPDPVLLVNVYDNEELLVEIFKELLKPDYEPPCNDLHGIQAHIMTLWVFYQLASPDWISVGNLLQLDLNTLKLIGVASWAAASMPHITNEVVRVHGVKGGKGRQGQSTLDAIAEAYRNLQQDFTIAWKGDDPYLNGKKVTLSNLAKRVSAKIDTDFLRRINKIDTGLSSKWVRSKLEELRKMGTI